MQVFFESAICLVCPRLAFADPKLRDDKSLVLEAQGLGFSLGLGFRAYGLDCKCCHLKLLGLRA